MRLDEFMAARVVNELGPITDASIHKGGVVSYLGKGLPRFLGRLIVERGSESRSKFDPT